MFHFRKKKREEIVQQAQITGMVPEQPMSVAFPEQNAMENQTFVQGLDTSPTADEIFEKTMAPTLSPKAFMEQNSIKDNFEEPKAVCETQILGAENMESDGLTEPTVRPEITAWQEAKKTEEETDTVPLKIPNDMQDDAPTTELFSDPAAHGYVEPDESKRVLKFIGNNGGALFYHSRQEEENIAATQRLKQQEEAGVWVCNCGTHNYATFCAQCGRSRDTIHR